MKTTRPGYIIVLSLMLTSAIVVLVTLLFTRGLIFIPFSNTIANREQARLLALSGVQVAISELSEVPEPEKEKKETGLPVKKKSPAEEQAIFFLENILPSLNRWQLFPLKERVDGIDGEIRIAISCEQGKININQIFDFEKGKFKGEGLPVGDWKKMLQELLKKVSQTGSENLVDALAKFLAKRKVPLEDVTQLLTIKEFATFKDNQFYEPPVPVRTGEKKRPFYLTDIFTISTNKSTLQPWLFSDSLLGLLDIKRAQPRDIEKREKMVDGWLKEFKLNTRWKEEWDKILKPMYEKSIDQLSKEPSFLDNSFDPTVFSVISYGTVEDTRQRLFAILERKKSSRDGKTHFTVTIKRLYWL